MAVKTGATKAVPVAKPKLAVKPAVADDGLEALLAQAPQLRRALLRSQPQPRALPEMRA